MQIVNDTSSKRYNNHIIKAQYSNKFRVAKTTCMSFSGRVGENFVVVTRKSHVDAENFY